MTAAPVLMQKEKFIELNKIKCYEHPNNQIIGICIDKNCKNESKYMCIDCMFEIHSGHVGLKLNQVEDNYNLKYNSYLNEYTIKNKEYNNYKNNLRLKINEAKNKINNELEEIYNNIIKDIDKKLNKFNSFEEIGLIKENYPPKNKNQLNTLIELLLKLYNNNKEQDKLPNGNIFNYYDDLLKEKIEPIEKNFSEFSVFPKLSNINTDFKWSTTTYNGYGFYYKLEENDTRATKISSGGTITVCRGNELLEKGCKYKLDYFVKYNGGDFDIGFGDERTAINAWLRGEKGYCISSDGLHINGKLCSKDIKILNGQKITFIIDLKTYNSELFINDQKKYNMSILSDLTYYPMIAIRELNNSVKFNLIKINN